MERVCGTAQEPHPGRTVCKEPASTPCGALERSKAANAPVTGLHNQNMTEDTTTEGIERPIKREDANTLEETLTENAYYNILPARYLRKDEDGNVIEDPEELFERVAKNIALADVVYEAEERGVEVEVRPAQVKHNYSNREDLVEEVFGPHASLDDEDVTVPLTEENVSKFSYDNVVPELEDEDLQESVEETKSNFQEMMESLGFMPNSPTLMNAGDELQQLSACFVNSPIDDITDIHEKITEAAQVFKSGGGMGYAFHHLRPYGDQVGSTGGIASGPISFMRTYDQMCATIAQGGTRRGAQMGIMRVSHPDVIHFIHAKNKDVSLKETLKLNDPDDYRHNSFVEALEEARELIDEEGKVPEHLRNAAEGHLSNFNISVGVTDDFMEALFNDEDFTFTNPRTCEPHIATAKTEEMYSWYGLDEYVEPGEPLEIPARVLWEHMIEGAHENGEPGMIFIDRVNEEHSFPVESNPTIDPDDPYSEYEIHATNPCGEQPLMEGEACNLGHINLSTVASLEVPDWRAWYDENGDDYNNLEDAVDAFLTSAIDWDILNDRVQKGTHFLENVVTMSDFPIDKITETVRANRKIGLGIMGLAQLYIQLGVKYGSDEANEVARQLMRHINHESKRVSRELAEQRGCFTNWDDSKYADPTIDPEWFKNQTGEDPTDWEDGFPMRNHNTTTIAPTGTTSMLGNTTGGCEPIYNVAYYKNVTSDVQGDEMLVEFDDYFLRTLEANDVDVEAAKQECQDQMANNEFDGVEGLKTVPNEIGELFITTGDLTAKEHASVQCALQEGVDSAISKTTNAPNDATVEDAMDAFEFVYRNGGKGVTYYRDGTRAKQVLTTRAENMEFDDEQEAAEIITDQILEAFGGLDAFLDHDEVRDTFTDELDGLVEAAETVAENAQEAATENNYFEPRPRPDALQGVSQRIETGYGKVYVTINEDKNGRPFELFANIGNSGGFTNSFTEALAKVISSALRAGVDPAEIQNELEGIRSPKVAWDRGEQISSIPDAIGTAMRRYLEGEIEKAYPDQSTIDEAAKKAQETLDDTDETDGEEIEANGGTTAATSVESDPNRNVEQKMEEDQQEMLQQGETPECPDCGSMTLYFSEGCKKCQSCGWSEC